MRNEFRISSALAVNAMRIHITHDDRNQRFLNTTTVGLQVNGAAAKEATGSAHGRRLFDVPDAAGTRVDLQIQIPDPDGGTILDLKQSTTVGTVSGVVSLVPSSSGRWAGHFHPRLTASSVRAGKGRIFEIAVDLTFLDVTNRARKGGVFADYDKMLPIPPTGSPSPPAHYGVTLRLLEYTKGKPVAWTAVVPPFFASKPDATDVGTFLFFRPTFDDYTNTDDIDLKRLLRYLGDPPIAFPKLQPFYSDGGNDPRRFIQAPRCGWERQLATPNKPVVLVHPMPHGEAFGDARDGNMPALLNAVVRTLWGDDVVGKSRASGVARKRVALGGFSFGGEAMFAAFNAHKGAVDELWLFDPNNFAANQRAILRWFAAGGKKVRLMGGMLHQSMLDFVGKLKGDASVKPETADYWQASDLYRAAVFLGTFAAAPGGIPAEPSTRTGLFVTAQTRGNTAIMLQGRDATGKVLGQEEIANCSNHEAVAMIRFTETLPPPPPKRPAPRPKIPMTTAKDLTANVKTIAAFTRGIRHQWPVSGGDDKAGHRDRGNDFVGYLQQCVEKSGF
jgi:hypothetical protein